MKALPASINEEKSILASILYSPDMIPEALDKLPTNMFYDTLNKQIYSLIRNCEKKEVFVDTETLINKNEHNSKLQGRLIEFGDYATSQDINGLIDTVRDSFFKREMIRKCTSFIEKSYSNDSDIKEIVSDFRDTEFKIYGKDKGKILEVNSFRQDVLMYYNNGFQNIGVSSGWKTLDEYYRPAKGTLNIITGIPGHGKSELLDALIVNISKNKGWKWVVFSPENYPYELHIQKLAEKFIGKSMLHYNRMTEIELEDAIKWINEYVKFIETDEDNIRLDIIMDLVLEAIKKYGIDGMIIDPWNEIEPDLKDGESETNYIRRSLSRIRRFTRKHNIITYIVAHPAKMYKNKAGEYDVPTLYNISGSAHWYNKADNGLCVFRDFDTGCVDVHIQKIKFKIHGKTGCVGMKYIQENGRFEGIGF